MLDLLARCNQFESQFITTECCRTSAQLRLRRPSPTRGQRVGQFRVGIVDGDRSFDQPAFGLALRFVSAAQECVLVLISDGGLRAGLTVAQIVDQACGAADRRRYPCTLENPGS